MYCFTLNRRKNPVFLYLLTFEKQLKAFNTLNRVELLKSCFTNVWFWLWHTDRNWFHVIYNQASSCVLHNGHASDFFLLELGVRQGCPLSGLLLVVGIEHLTNVPIKDPTIKGSKVDQKEIKITHYADNTTVLARYLHSVTQTLKYLDKFKQISGLEINTNKTEVLCLGCSRSRKDKPFGFKWPQEPVYAPGIPFSYDLRQANTLHVEEKLCSLEKKKKKKKHSTIGKKKPNFNWQNQYCQNTRFV